MSGEIERPVRPGMFVDPAQTPTTLMEPSMQPGQAPDVQRTRHRDADGTPAHPPPRKAGELDPEWVMVGVDVPAGKRLYASKDLKGSAFELAVDEHFNGDGWHLTSTMQKMLVITKSTYGECLAELMRIWANWENEGRELPAGHGIVRREQQGEVTA